jgi:hypothetical protein
VSAKFKVPSTVEEAKGVAGTLSKKISKDEQQLNLSRVEMGAIAYAFIEVEGYTPTKLAKQKLPGLTGSTTCKAYSEGYKYLLSEGLVPPAVLGEVIELPEDIRFPATGHDRRKNDKYSEQYEVEAEKLGVSAGSVERAALNLRAVEAAAAANPEFAKAAARGQQRAALEKLAEKGHKLQEELEAEGIDTSYQPAEREPSELEIHADAMVEIGKVADKAFHIRDLVAQAKAELEALVAEQGAVGDSLIVATLQEAGSLATDIATSVFSFTLQDQEA